MAQDEFSELMGQLSEEAIEERRREFRRERLRAALRRVREVVLLAILLALVGAGIWHRDRIGAEVRKAWSAAFPAEQGKRKDSPQSKLEREIQAIEKAAQKRDKAVEETFR